MRFRCVGNDANSRGVHTPVHTRNVDQPAKSEGVVAGLRRSELGLLRSPSGLPDNSNPLASECVAMQKVVGSSPIIRF